MSNKILTTQLFPAMLSETPARIAALTGPVQVQVAPGAGVWADVRPESI